MARYRVTARRYEYFVFDVEADTADEARETYWHNGTEVEQFNEVESEAFGKEDGELPFYVVKVETE